MKRITHMPQLVLGATFNWGALMGWTAVSGTFSAPHLMPLYTAGVCWTLIYDTLYGYQDRKDDAKLGLKSTALYLGDSPQWPLSAVAVGMVGSLMLVGYEAELTLPYYVGVAGLSSHLAWQIWTADINSPKNLWARFNSNKYAGAVLGAAIVAGHFG